MFGDTRQLLERSIAREVDIQKPCAGQVVRFVVFTDGKDGTFDDTSIETVIDLWSMGLA